jgi:zinc transporter ZupT
VLYCLIAGISMPIGAFIAWGAVGGTLRFDSSLGPFTCLHVPHISFPPSPIVYAILFGLIAGIMVFISVRELIPTGAHACVVFSRDLRLL